MVLLNDKKMKIKNHLTQNLMFRDSANVFFNLINKQVSSNIILDFSGVESITRSFANQYLNNKEITDKKIIEINVPKKIQKMFDLVKEQSLKPRIYKWIECTEYLDEIKELNNKSRKIEGVFYHVDKLDTDEVKKEIQNYPKCENDIKEFVIFQCKNRLFEVRDLRNILTHRTLKDKELDIIVYGNCTKEAKELAESEPYIKLKCLAKDKIIGKN